MDLIKKNYKKCANNALDAARSRAMSNFLQMKQLRIRKPELEFKSPTKPVLILICQANLK